MKSGYVGRRREVQRPLLAVDGLYELKLLLVIDNLEDALDLETRRVADPDLAGFLDALATNLTQGSRALVTCRLLPEGTPTGLPNVLHLPVLEFLPHDILKFLRRDEVVDRRIGRGELTGNLIDRLQRTLGGTPGLLAQVRTLLRKADPDALLEELEGGDPGLLAREREAYCSKILTNRLYAALSPQAQALAGRMAISILPIPAEAAAPLANLTEVEAAKTLDEGVAYGLLQRFDEPNLPSLYHPPGLLRPWLAGKIAEDEAKAVHAHLAKFRRASYEADREAELRVAFIAELEASREHSRNAEDGPTFQWSTLLLASQLGRRSEWDQARSLLEEIPEAAREATTWHQLASIDLYQGDYAAAREKFDTSLEIKQAIGDRAGGAASFWQLGFLAHEMDRGHHATRLVAVCCMIDHAIGHGDAGSNFRTLSTSCSNLGYDQDQFNARLAEVSAAYGQDRGWGLIERAFAEK